MNQPPGINPLRTTETLYRRIAKVWVIEGQISLDAFKPHPTDDIDGLSLTREAAGADGAAATGKSGKEFYIAESTVGGIEATNSLTVTADTDIHAVVPQMNSELRRSKDKHRKDQLDIWARALHLLFRKYPVQGPYLGKS